MEDLTLPNFDLDQKTLDYIFENIASRFTEKLKSSDNPHLAIVAGQPGAGKSTVVWAIIEKFAADNPPLIVDMDDLRLYHPHEKEIFKKHPFLYDEITGRAAGKWNKLLLELARDKSFETVYQTTLAKQFFAEKVVREFNERKYGVSLHCLSVASKLSVLGIFARFERDYDTQKSPRWTDIPYHDMAYVQFPLNAQVFEETLPLDKVVAYRRNGRVVYENTRIKDVWENLPSVHPTIEKDRSLPWSKKQKNAYVRDWAEVVDRYTRRFGGTTELSFKQRIEEAKSFFDEATLYARAVLPKPTDKIEKGVKHATTHHHIFAEIGGKRRLVVFDKN